MKRFSPAWLALLALTCAVAQSDDQLGMSDDQIIKLGKQRWYEKFVAKNGESTAGMSEAHQIFARVLKRRNDRLALKRSFAERKRMHDLRVKLRAFGEKMLAAGEGMSGGGTMWIPVYSSNAADAEEALYAVISNSGTMSKTKETDVVDQLTALATKVDAKKADFDSLGNENYSYESIKKNLAGAQNEWNEVVAVSKELPAPAAAGVYAYCYDTIRTVREMGLPELLLLRRSIR